MERPIERAEEVIDAYQTHFIGSAGPAARGVSHRIEKTANAQSFIGTKGPLLQALPIANWSPRSWETFAVDQSIGPLVRLAFSELGFKRLYDFQERSIEAVKNGDNTIITAATGRGKTEAWLIPIIDEILMAKRGKHESLDPDGVKAILIYPTKALAQDQLKRLIQYLYRINTQLPTKERITVGIYDGDTPTNPSSKAEGYLNSTFKYFQCPGYNDSLEKCQGCGKSVHIRATSTGYHLEPEKARCIDDVPLDFIKLTKNKILNEGVDIILTNPDTINLKLVNINARDEHNAFIYEPKFLVFDEVHTYDSLFGSYTATLTKRIRALRAREDVEPLQVIASSATVENSVELFRKISGAKKVTHIAERPRQLSPEVPNKIPKQLYNSEIRLAEIVSAARGNRKPPEVLQSFTYSIDDPEKYDTERTQEIIAEELYDYFTKSTQNDTVKVIQSLHQHLSESPATKSEVITHICEQYGVSEPEAETVLSNFRTLGEFSGLLENRSHLFSWPLDGYYACAQCDAVYRSVQEECSECGHDFVSRTRYCRRCHDEHLVAWCCHKCNQMQPYIPNEEGNRVRDEVPSCQYCSETEETPNQLTLVTFQPMLQCQQCQSTERRSLTKECECGAETVRTSPHTMTCINPVCGAEHSADLACSTCGDTKLTVKTIHSTVECVSCEKVYETTKVPDTCSCGRNLTQSRYLGWVCGNDGCHRTHFTESPPDVCDCGQSSVFARDGLHEVFNYEVCHDCDTEVIPGGECRCEDIDAVSERQHREDNHKAMKIIDSGGRIRHPSQFRTATGCRHTRLSYDPSRRFDELVRSPNNVAVTTSQYLLRSVADEEGPEVAKLLSFADSHRDMNELNRDFNEPEVETLLDQVVLNVIQRDDSEITASQSKWKQFDWVLTESLNLIDEFDQQLSPPDTVRNVDFKLKENLLKRVHRRFDTTDEGIRERLRRRTIPHTYQPQLRERGGSLVENGLLAVRLRPDLLHTLSEFERVVVRDIVNEGNGLHISDITQPDVSIEIMDIVLDLVQKGIIEEESEADVSLSPSALEVTTVGENTPIWFDPYAKSYYAPLHLQFGTIPDSAVPLTASIEKRATPEATLFSGRAFRATYSSTRVLVGRVYHGMTDKRARRELEYLFREGEYPHFLSSGPTMELGVDIGALDALLLYGTPPNMNAYLQRVGRAGRRSNSALVHSVSQRNPIDFYYYDNPAALISAEPKPVPLNEHNESVLRISLTWAVLDYLASEFQIPWEVEYAGSYPSVSGGDDFRRLSEENQTEVYSKLTQLMTVRIKELGLDTRTSKLSALGTLVHDHQREIKTHLQSVLDYSYCKICGKKYDRQRAGHRCEENTCTGELINAVAEYTELIDETVQLFTNRFIDEYPRYRNQIEKEVQQLQSEQLEIRRKRRHADEITTKRLLRQKNAIGARKEALEQHLNTIEKYEYTEFLSISRQSEFSFNMRNVSSSVGLTLVNKRDSKYKRSEIGGGYGGREMRMAIKDLHPCAAYLHSGETYIVANVRFDEFEGSELRKLASESDNNTLAYELVCPTCKEAYPIDKTQCTCGTDVPLKQRKLVALDTVEAYRDDLVTTPDGMEARYLLENPDEEVQNTFAERDTTILSFEPTNRFVLRDTDGNAVGTIVHGSYSVLLHTESYRAKYKSGNVDPQETLFEVCGEQNCDGVIYKDEDENARCSANAEHSPNRRGAPSEYVRLGYTYQTDGLRVSLSTIEQSHTFAHGIRVALQSLAGVSIREIAEVVDETEGYVDIFDATEGGADVSRQFITSEGGEYDNFLEALEIMNEQFDCSCENGCPLCLYQYGCDKRNKHQLFDRRSVANLLSQSNFRLTVNDQD